MKNKKIDPEESLEKFKTDLAEYNFILEQQYKNEVKIIIPQEQKKKKIWYNNLVGNNIDNKRIKVVNKMSDYNNQEVTAEQQINNEEIVEKIFFTLSAWGLLQWFFFASINFFFKISFLILL